MVEYYANPKLMNKNLYPNGDPRTQRSKPKSGNGQLLALMKGLQIYEAKNLEKKLVKPFDLVTMY